MGKTVKILLMLTLLISIGCFTLGIVLAQQAGMTIQDLAKLVQSNLEEINISPVTQEYSAIQETLSLTEQADKPHIVIRNTFPDVTITEGDEFKVELLGEVSSKLDHLLSWSADLDTIYINIASVFNENPSSTGLKALVTLPHALVDNVTIESVSGDVTISNGPVINHSQIQTKSGNVTIEDTQIYSLATTTVSGNLEATSFDNLVVDCVSVSGDLNLAIDSLSGRLKSESGRISTQISDLHNDLLLENESGAIAVIYDGDGFNYELSSNSGRLTVNREVFEHQVTVESIQNSYLLKATTTTGYVNLKFEP